jgi:ferredoxin
MRMVWIRRTVQVLFLLFFLWLFVHATWELESAIPVDLFLRADPLAALCAIISGSGALLVRLWPAAIILGVTVLLGRVFCGWVCPLGTIIDLSDRLFWRKRTKRLEKPRWPRLKYYLLVLVLFAALFRTQLGYLFDPIPTLTRVTTLTVYPLANRLQVAWVADGRAIWRPLEKHGVLSRPKLPTPPDPSFALNLVTFALFAGILAAGAFSRRFWCRNLCALGGLLAFCGRYGLLKREVTESCTRCRRCARPCKMGAIPEDEPQTTLLPECIQCYNCVPDCRDGHTNIGFHWLPAGAKPEVDLERRRLLQAAGVGVAYSLLTRTGVPRKAYAHSDRLIRPPGAAPHRVTEEQLRALCVRCGECMKVCVTGGIQPALHEAGLEGLWTPVLVPRIGYCEEKCIACGQVCPTGALRPFRQEEKKDIVIGLATIHQDKCLAWRRDEYYKRCLVCDEQCPYKAVTNRAFQGELRPFVDESKCTGCGTCEYKCPVKPEAAIVVYRNDLKE